MHQNWHTTHEVGVDILDLKVIDKHRIIKNLNFGAEYSRGSSVKVVNLVAISKIACGNPTLADYIERVVSSGVDIALIGVEVQYLIDGVNKYLCNGFKLGLSGLNVVCSNLVADLDPVNALLSAVNRYERITRKAMN